nr:MAG TPA: hypothetical protein [Caudoviricetes sp.]
MAYKIQFYNRITQQIYFGDEEYRTFGEAARKAAYIEFSLPKDVILEGIKEACETPIDNASETTERYDLTDDGKGKKYDSGKSMVGTLCRVFPRALLGIGQCIEFGTRKYPKPDNWKLVDGAFTRYQDSMMRHYLKFLAGQEKDSETNLLHLKHMVWNALAILELYLMDHEDETLFK